MSDEQISTLNLLGTISNTLESCEEMLLALNKMSVKYDNNAKFTDNNTFCNAGYHLEEAIKEFGYVRDCINGQM